MDRKTQRILGALSLLPMAAAAFAQTTPAALTAQSGTSWTFHHENILGTSLDLTVRAADRKSALAAEAAALATFEREATILSAWRPRSEFSQWAQTRFEPVSVSPELFATLATFDRWRERTNGALDPSVEAATRLWKQTTGQGRTPTKTEIAQTVEAIAQPHWSLDAAQHTATRLTDVPLALASFVKSRITAKAANAALAAGATGIMLNVGGDVVVRGAMTQQVAISNPAASAENEPALDRVLVTDSAVATSGGYRRGFEIATSAASQPAFSHLIDPRTAQPVGHILSSTVIARDAETAGALATAFSVMPLAESRQLAAATPGVDYLIVDSEGRSFTSTGWAKYQLPGQHDGSLQPVSYTPPVKAAAGAWDVAFELAIELNLPRMDDARYRRPYVAVWIEDADHFPVRTISLWTQKPRWLPDLKQWYRDDQIRNLAEGTDISSTVSSATRPPGKYTLKWDGKDNQGKPVKPGTYTVVIEAAREHGSYQIERRSLGFTGKPQQVTVPAGAELGSLVLDYRKR